MLNPNWYPMPAPMIVRAEISTTYSESKGNLSITNFGIGGAGI